jgi:hypothetical protein
MLEKQAAAFEILPRLILSNYETVPVSRKVWHNGSWRSSFLRFVDASLGRILLFSVLSLVYLDGYQSSSKANKGLIVDI